MTDARDAEERIVQDYLRPLTGGAAEALGLVDDCALVSPTAGEQLVFKTDAVVAGTHFFADDRAADIAFKALAVNVSDLIAKAAKPRFWQMTLALPNAPGPDWLTGLCSGFAEVQAQSGIRLIGGDLVKTKGPLVISITAVGSVATGRMLRRGGGRAGDLIYVSGSIGDAALGLAVRAGGDGPTPWPLSSAHRAFLLARYLRPHLRMGLAPALTQHATAGMDVSDGLVIDFGRMCRAAGLGGYLNAVNVPLSDAARAVIAADPTQFRTALGGGDDYEVLAAIAPQDCTAFEAAARHAQVTVTQIGELTTQQEVLVLDRDDQAIDLGPGGYVHF